MKQYVIDEIRAGDINLLKSYLDESFGPMVLNGIYRMPLDPGLYSGCQKTHTDCHPFYFALELKNDALSCEMLVRTDSRVRCDCIAMATQEQRNWLIESIDSIFERLSIVA
jgi:hypothetical protein